MMTINFKVFLSKYFLIFNAIFCKVFCMKFDLVKLITIVSCLVMFTGCSSDKPSKSRMEELVGQYYKEKNIEFIDLDVSKIECLPTKTENRYDCDVEISLQCKVSGKKIDKATTRANMKKANNEWHLIFIRGACW